MGKRTKLAATVPFAHLLGIRAESEDDEDKKKEDAKAKAEGDDDKKDESDKDKAKKAEDDAPEKKDDDQAKGSKAEDGDGDEDDTKKKDDAKAAVAAERARCKAIVAFGVANGCVRTAGTFAFDTDMSADAAIAALSASKADAREGDTLSKRMEGVTDTAVGSDAPSGPDMSTAAGRSKAQADSIIASLRKVRGEKTA